MPYDFWTFLRFSQLLHDSPYLSGRKRLAGGFVACLLQLFPKLGAAANPVHQVAHSRAWAAVGEVHQGQFLLRVGAYFKIIHINSKSPPCSPKGGVIGSIKC